MNKAIILSLLAATGLSAGAALPIFEDPIQLDMPVGSFHPVMSPDGSKLLFSTMDHTGLQCLDMASGDIAIIDSRAAAGFQPVFSLDGQKVIYRTAQKVDGLVNRDVREYSLATAKHKVIAPLSREQVKLATVDRTTYAVSAFDKINVTIDGKTMMIDPVEDAHSYLWASLSPDGSKLLFTEAFKGVFVANVDGTDARQINPKGIYPCWIDNNTIASVSQTDDGYFITSSHVTISDITTGQNATITGDEVLVDELTTSVNTGAIVYSTLDGEMYILNPKTR